MNDTDAHAPAFDPMDPHGSTHAGGHHGHVIVGWKTQLAVLGALLALTALTVGVAQAESFLIAELNVTIPHWVNIIGAMIIATVKAVLVCAFFMQLKYDKPLNTIVFLFCLFCVFLFLFFATLDLTHRDTISDQRAVVLVPGGTGVGLNNTVDDGTWSAGIGPRPTINNQPITDFRFEQKRNEYESDEAMWKYYYAKQDHPHRHEKDAENYFALLGFDHHAERSTEERSRPRRGLTPDLFAEHAAHGPSHHDDHADEHHDDAEHAGEEAGGDDHGEDDGH